MKLAQLRELVAQSAPPEAHEEDTAHGQRDDMRQSGGLRLAPDPQAKQDGGHSFRKDGSIWGFRSGAGPRVSYSGNFST